VIDWPESMNNGAVPENGTPFEPHWRDTLVRRFRFIFDSWYESFVGDDSRLIRRNIYRECSRSDVDPETWAEFFTDIISLPRPAA
jgi:hypothetical protein